MPSVYSSKEFEGQFTYEGNDLGATWSKAKTTFKVWAPTAEEVKVNLYTSGTKGTNDLIESIDMTKGEKGVWTAVKTGDLNGTYYTYMAVQEGVSTEACDPYARTTGVNGDRAMVIDLDSTDPAGWANDSGPNQGMSYNDSVIYELHVRDFSIDESSGISDKHKGKFLGLTEKGTTNGNGETTGLDYLVDLGVTHIHLLPSYDYGSVDETKLNTPQYNWGYDPVNYNVPEGSYSTNPYNGETRVKEMKQMIKTLHDNDINVIMDVVYNHVYDADEFCFNQLVPQYFSRTNADGSYSNASGCGNDTASERAMVRKYIVDSVNYWADEYHIDGFRFDLVGLLDTETINEVVNTVHQ
ncbi:MAG: type I pullulanase, partial [Lachnospiraceae bacterium]|nr:type I pullulanase [Lachnospiraceae bacterium]